MTNEQPWTNLRQDNYTEHILSVLFNAIFKFNSSRATKSLNLPYGERLTENQENSHEF